MKEVIPTTSKQFLVYKPCVGGINNLCFRSKYIPSFIHRCLCYTLCSVSVHFVFTHILQGYFTGTGAILGLPQCQWSNHEEYELISKNFILSMLESSGCCHTDILFAIISKFWNNLWTEIYIINKWVFLKFASKLDFEWISCIVTALPTYCSIL